MKINDLIIHGDNIPNFSEAKKLTGVRPRYLYNDGKRTETISGYNYEVVILGGRFLKLLVYVEGENIFPHYEDDMNIIVEFENFSGSLYNTMNGVNFSFRADNLSEV